MGGPIGTHLKRGFESWQNSSKRKPKPLQTKEGKGKMRLSVTEMLKRALGAFWTLIFKSTLFRGNSTCGSITTAGKR
eukprot:6384800-Pyramimonas_sp.AAC.2